jgi:hypothetical protein
MATCRCAAVEPVSSELEGAVVVGLSSSRRSWDRLERLPVLGAMRWVLRVGTRSFAAQRPFRLGDDIEAKDPAHASALLADAAIKTRRALSVTESEAEELLKDVFGNPDERAAIIGKSPVWVTPGGALKGIAAGGTVAGGRAVPTVRSHGDGE